MFGDSSSEDEQEAQLRPAGCGVMQWHSGTEEAMFLYVERCVKKMGERATGDELVDTILRSVDDFCSKRHWMMHVGPEKAQHLVNAIRTVQRAPGSSLTFLELGSYCGYSSVLIARELRKMDSNSGVQSHLVCIEPYEEAVRYTQRMARLAGLDNYICILKTTVDDPNLPQLITSAARTITDTEPLRLDLVFIDHDKSRYLKDLVILEGLQAPHTTHSEILNLAPAAAPKQRRILCLHGHEQNSETLRKRLGGLPRKMKGSKFVFLDGPIILPPRESEVANSEDTEGKCLRSWWHRDADGQIDAASLQEVLRLVQSTWETDGPFDGILGFSMGGTLASQIVMWLPCPGLKFVICAGAPDHFSVLPEKLPTHLRSLHIWGTTDLAVDCSRSRSLRDKWSMRCLAPVTIEHGSGHCIPTQAVYLQQYCAFMEAAMEANDAPSLPVPPVASHSMAPVPLLRSGCVVVADNVLSFGVPLTEYLSHVRDPEGPYRSSEIHKETVEYSMVGVETDAPEEVNAMYEDGIEVSILK
jgi:catechol O-methyltransferase